MKLSIIAFCLLLTSCKVQRGIDKSEAQIQDSYMYTFKITYFKKLLIEAFNKSDEFKKIITTDQSGYGENILSIEDQKLIDSLIKIDNQAMIQDSISRIGKVAEGAQGKHVLDYALYKYESKWLNRLAKERYKIYTQRKNS